MKTKKRQKLCYNCEGEVDLDVIFCPFCGTDLLEEKNEIEPSSSSTQTDPFRTLSANESNSSLYPPPYSPESAEEEREEVLSEEENTQKRVSPFIPLLFLTLGSWFASLAILLFIFSENGVVLLRFDAKMWLTYLLISAPFFFIGTKFLKKME